MALVDSRLTRLAQILVRYSLDVQPGNLVAIHGGIEATPLLLEVYRETLRAGGHPQFDLELEEAREIYLKEANDAHLDFVSPVTRLIKEQYERLLYVDAETNTRRLSRVNPARAARRRKAHDQVDTLWSQRAAQGLMRWCYTIPHSGLCTGCTHVSGRLLRVRLQRWHAQRSRSHRPLARNGLTAKNPHSLASWAQASAHSGRRYRPDPLDRRSSLPGL